MDRVLQDFQDQIDRLQGQIQRLSSIITAQENDLTSVKRFLTTQNGLPRTYFTNTPMTSSAREQFLLQRQN